MTLESGSFMQPVPEPSLEPESAAELRRTRDRQPAEQVGIEEVAREAAAEINKLYPGQIIGYDFGEPTPFLTVSRSALRQVLVQLLRNAAQSGVAGRPVRIEIGGRRTPAGV